MIEWFLATRVGRGLAIAGAIVLALLTTWFAALHRGAKAQAVVDDAKAAQADAAAQAAAHSLYKESSDAAQAVAKQADAQPPPDVEQRNDFESRF